MPEPEFKHNKTVRLVKLQPFRKALLLQAPQFGDVLPYSSFLDVIFSHSNVSTLLWSERSEDGSTFADQAPGSVCVCLSMPADL